MARITLLVCVVLGLLSLALAQMRCPNSCNHPNGVCLSTGVCQCTTDWRGIDCSIFDKAITPNRPIPEVGVTQGEWRYYHYNLAGGQTHRVKLTILVPPSSANADADVYIRKGTELPTRSTYDWSHTGTGRIASIDVPAQTSNTNFIVGIYGYITVAKYKLEVTTSACPNDCSGHGTCNTITSVCTCSAGWFGAACNMTATQAPNSPSDWKTEQLTNKQWVYYYHTVASGTSALNISVVQDPGMTGDVDIYVKAGSFPTFSSFDFADTTTRKSFSIVVPEPRAGTTYYIGFYAFTAARWRWNFVSKSQVSGECPNKCSGASHGTCDASSQTCRCQAGFSGPGCIQMTRDLVVGTDVVNGYVSQGEWNYYSATPRTAAPMTITVTHQAGEDCDIYVQRDRNPTRFDFSYRDITYAQTINIVVTNPGESSWKVGILGFSANCNYQITTSVAPANQCPAQCTQNGGTCRGTSSVCECPANKAGQFCEYPLLPIRSGQTLTGSVAPNKWVYYKYSGPASAFSITLNEQNVAPNAGVLWLYSSIYASPTLTEFDWQDTSTGTNTHRIVVEIHHHIDNAHYYIGVYGSPLALNLRNEFRLTTWAAPFK